MKKIFLFLVLEFTFLNPKSDTFVDSQIEKRFFNILNCFFIKNDTFFVFEKLKKGTRKCFSFSHGLALRHYIFLEAVIRKTILKRIKIFTIRNDPG